MTSYHGGKQLLGKELATIILDIIEANRSWIKGYTEPFCGMLGVMRYVASNTDGLQLLAGDIHGSVIEMWKALQKGWVPPTKVSQSMYEALRKNRFNTPDSALKGYVGHQYSFAGIYFGSFRDNYATVQHTKARERVLTIAQEIKKVKFKKGNYTQFSHLRGHVIYCDCPYSGKVQKYLEKFDTDRFIEWCIQMSKYNIVLVSGMEDIPEATLIYEKQVRHNVEKLFMFI